MAEQGETETVARKSSRRRLLIGIGAAILLGAGAFVVTYAGLLSRGADRAGSAPDHGEKVVAGFVPIEPILVSLAPGGQARHLRFRAELEVDPAQQHSVELLMPRVLDVLNSYLRAVDVTDLERSTSLIGLRAQMLRRIQLVVGDGRVHDLLITEFVLN